MKPWLPRVGWFAALWIGGVAALAVVALLFHLALTAAGLTG